MNNWWWQKPLADPNGGDRTSSYVEHLLIDFVMLSPSLKDKITKPPTIYAFDKDPEIIAQATDSVALPRLRPQARISGVGCLAVPIGVGPTICFPVPRACL